MKTLLFVWFFSYSFCAAQSASVEVGRPTFEELVLSRRVPQFTLLQGTIYDGLKSLSAGPVPFAFGFEEVLKEKFSDTEIRDPRFDLRLENKTVRNILDALCASDSRYTWSSDTFTVNVHPRATAADVTYLLNRRLPRLELAGITDIDQGLLAVVHQLPPPEEQVAHVQTGGDSSYPLEPWHASFQDLSVRQAMNRLVAHMGQHACWIFHGSRDFRAFTFFRTGFSESPGDSAGAKWAGRVGH
jgi:hypothetical protein